MQVPIVLDSSHRFAATVDGSKLTIQIRKNNTATGQVPNTTGTGRVRKTVIDRIHTGTNQTGKTSLKYKIQMLEKKQAELKKKLLTVQKNINKTKNHQLARQHFKPQS